MQMNRFQIADGVSLSRIAYGMSRMAEAEDTGPGAVLGRLDACLGQGITTLDQADIYGDYRAEAMLGDAFAQRPGLRDSFEIVTKAGVVMAGGRVAGARLRYYDTSRAHILASVDASLKALRTDRVDLLLIHRPDPLMDPAETGAVLDDLVRTGKARAVGVSNFQPHDMALLQDHMVQPLVVNQIEISLAAPEPVTNGELAYQQRAGMVPMAWSPLAGGALFAGARPALLAVLREMAAEKDCDIAALAVAWLLAHPAGILPVMGTNRLERIARLTDALQVSLDRQDWFTLYAAAVGHEVP